MSLPGAEAQQNAAIASSPPQAQQPVQGLSPRRANLEGSLLEFSFLAYQKKRSSLTCLWLGPLLHCPKRGNGSLNENAARSFRCEVRKGEAAALEKQEEATSGGRRENQGNRSRNAMNAERREVEIG
jgi:hypothetical protein